jgi:hypothetical protein
MSLGISILLLALAPCLAWADLGDKLEIARIKYGQPSPTGNQHILSYTHAPWHIWQTYDDKGVCIIAEFAPLNRGPLTLAGCRELDRNNLPGLTPGSGPGWAEVIWPNTVSYQYTGKTLFQVMDGQSRDKVGWYYSRMYLNAEGIEWIKALGGGL